MNQRSWWLYPSSSCRADGNTHRVDFLKTTFHRVLKVLLWPWEMIDSCRMSIMLTTQLLRCFEKIFIQQCSIFRTHTGILSVVSFGHLCLSRQHIRSKFIDQFQRTKPRTNIFCLIHAAAKTTVYTERESVLQFRTDLMFSRKYCAPRITASIALYRRGPRFMGGKILQMCVLMNVT